MMDVKTTKTWEDLSLCRSVSTISSSASTAEATAGNDVSSFLFDDCRDDASLVKSPCKFWLCVGHLSLGTTDAELKSLFYPYGADEAFTAWEGPQMSGFVGFTSPEMADLAAQKMHAFIPRRQSQALVVHPVSLDDVAQARSRSLKSLLAVLYSESAPQAISALIQHSKLPAAMAGEVATEVARASPVVLQRLVSALAGLSTQWAGFVAFNEELLKLLLRSLLEANELNPAQSINCGAVVGNLFMLNMITGDPYYLATRLLQRGSQQLAQLEGVCALAHTCTPLTTYHISRAAFWAQVTEMATMAADAETSEVLLGHLRRYTKSATPQSAAASLQPARASLPHPFSTMPCPPPTTSLPHHTQPFVPLSAPRTFAQHSRQDEVKRRTIYVSHLPGLLPQNMLLELLTAAGAVNKIRICAGTGYCTLFAFVEMRTLEGAQRAMSMNGLQLMGFAIRVQTARNAVQDVVKEDAHFDSDGNLLQPCLFGATQAPLSQCLTSMS
ncbi:hypothetical protein ABB37_09821 [Leptomonas pyrrhocoris]|uniref:RRM domain-containing protein n=1 Tax=Leptomonas pyrrhocoris TaxID=157538 RepID=A0A0M9FPM5_LEPPY|nr:hypothetical protein ABB37_09821 [Leptomonas pyrrhocoris]KPA73505.1 hypothetical protein ABB37_09821 [Leptomonas pyrrhocoris]|eukprot:XP_015651944.1 hypothetical protein ABB37_09821 [Leptomonas pyrrhocoris]